MGFTGFVTDIRIYRRCMILLPWRDAAVVPVFHRCREAAHDEPVPGTLCTWWEQASHLGAYDRLLSPSSWSSWTEESETVQYL